nr:immunoglobulin heavy chain junction region [Mus musculus]
HISVQDGGDGGL